MIVKEVIEALSSADPNLIVSLNGYEVTEIKTDTFFDPESGEEYDTLDMLTKKEVKYHKLKCPFRKRTRTISNIALGPMAHEMDEEFADCYGSDCPCYEMAREEQGVLRFRCRKAAIEGSKAK